MHDAIIAADEIYSVALQILNDRGVDAMAVPLVTSSVKQRLDAFAIGAMARELNTNEQEEADG